MRSLVSGSICAALLLLNAPVHAVEPDGFDPRMATALSRVDKGTWTQADLDYIKTDPDLAAQVPDPRPAATESGAVSGKVTGDLTALASATCNWYYYAWYRKRSLLGFTMYKYYHRAYYCKTSQEITKWQVREDYWRDVTSVAYWRELVQNSKAGIGTSTATTTRQRHIELCVVKYGCYSSLYPWVTLKIRANGNNTYSGDAG